jgi:hypothetical protein
MLLLAGDCGDVVDDDVAAGAVDAEESREDDMIAISLIGIGGSLFDDDDVSTMLSSLSLSLLRLFL